MMQKTYPPVIIVDENDNEIGLAPLAEAWQKGLYHRIVSIFVQDEDGNLLLQLRSSNVKVYPDCWDQSAAGHVDEGHSYEEAAVKELAEETGLTSVKLTPLGTFRLNDTLDDGRINNQFERVYLTQIPRNTELHAEPEEITELRWFSPTELKAQIAAQPERFTPGLLYALRKYFPELDV